MFDQCVPLIRDVDPKVVKMSRAMYDSPKEVRSLRDEILDLLDGGAPRVAVEIVARSAHEQLLIREMVEDSPSVDAQTCHKRILHKEGGSSSSCASATASARRRSSRARASSSSDPCREADRRCRVRSAVSEVSW